MRQPLVLSLFPGIGLLDMAFEEEGFCVVRGPDVLWGGDIRRFHPPAGVFDGVIGGPPCPFASSAANVARAAGKTVKPDLIPEFARCVAEARPRWWVMENVPGSHGPDFYGEEAIHTLDLLYAVNREQIDNRHFGGVQHRQRWIYSNLHLPFDVALFEAQERAPTASTSVWKDGRQYGDHTEKRFREVVRLQGLPEGFDLPGFTVREKLHAVVNGVPLPMGRAIARAVKAGDGLRDGGRVRVTLHATCLRRIEQLERELQHREQTLTETNLRRMDAEGEVRHLKARLAGCSCDWTRVEMPAATGGAART